MQRKFIKDMKSWECFFLTMFRRLQGSNNKFRCIQHCDTLNLQNNACLCNHFRLTVNIPNKRFLILILIRILISWIFCYRWKDGQGVMNLVSYLFVEILIFCDQRLHWDIEIFMWNLVLMMGIDSMIYMNFYYDNKCYNRNVLKFILSSLAYFSLLC